MNNIPDQKLFKKAMYGEKDFFVLAILSTVLLTILLFISIISEQSIFWLPLTGILLITISYYSLAVATGRGEENGLTVVIVFMMIQLSLSIFISILFSGQLTSGLNILFSILIIAILCRDRKVLIALKKSGFHEQIFQGKKSGKKLCRIGSIIFILGVLTLNSGAIMMFITIKHTKARAIKFTAILGNEENTALSNLRNYIESLTPENKQKSIKSLEDLKKAMTALREESKDTQPKLKEITDTYLKAVGYWEAGIKGYSTAPLDPVAINKSFSSGDRYRQMAIDSYNKAYAKK